MVYVCVLDGCRPYVIAYAVVSMYVHYACGCDALKLHQQN